LFLATVFQARISKSLLRY